MEHYIICSYVENILYNTIKIRLSYYLDISLGFPVSENIC